MLKRRIAELEAGIDGLYRDLNGTVKKLRAVIDTDADTEVVDEAEAFLRSLGGATAQQGEPKP
jgi:hypothetical protein